MAKTENYQTVDKSKPTVYGRGFVFEKVISNETSAIYRCVIGDTLKHQLAAIEFKVTFSAYTERAASGAATISRAQCYNSTDA